MNEKYAALEMKLLEGMHYIYTQNDQYPTTKALTYVAFLKLL